VAPFAEPIGNDVQQLTDEERQRLLERTAGAGTDVRPDVRSDQLLGLGDVARPADVNELLTGSGNGGQLLGAGRSLFGIGQGIEPGSGSGSGSGSGGDGATGAGRGLLGSGRPDADAPESVSGIVRGSGAPGAPAGGPAGGPGSSGVSFGGVGGAGGGGSQDFRGVDQPAAGTVQPPATGTRPAEQRP
jgi:hypothetical protein